MFTRRNDKIMISQLVKFIKVLNMKIRHGYENKT